MNMAEARTLLQLFRGMPEGRSHAARLEAFYRPQAERYDAFRERLLHGRAELVERLEIGEGMRIVELGCGTGSSLDRMGASASRCAGIELVDLCPALLSVARQRARTHNNVKVIEGDAACWQPAVAVDRVLLSYALSMIPDWRGVIANAVAMLKPGGCLGVVDFHLPSSGSKLGNGFWRRWFAHDGVHLSAEHLPCLRRKLAMTWAEERSAPIPYLPVVRAPYYLFVGRVVAR
jgi:S-adenosylmethionine-diacylgycerolhomoserine-N-methlytransferase